MEYEFFLKTFYCLLEKVIFLRKSSDQILIQQFISTLGVINLRKIFDQSSESFQT